MTNPTTPPETETEPVKPPFLPDLVYNILKYTAIYAISPLVVFTGALGTIWNIGWMQPVSLTIAAIGTLLAGLLGYSTATHNK
jgi:hypothetical protein